MQWDDTVDDIITGDAAAGFAYVTPAKGTVTVTSSLGLPKKIARLRENPSVAIAYHAREHGYSDWPEYVVAQGTASVPPDLTGHGWSRSLSSGSSSSVRDTASGSAAASTSTTGSASRSP